MSAYVIQGCLSVGRRGAAPETAKKDWRVNGSTPINLAFRRLAKEMHDVPGSLVRRQKRDGDLPGAAALAA
jgi:hypothetical protein